MHYTGSSGAVAFTTAKDFIELLCPSDAVLVIKKIVLSQQTEFGDAQEEQLRITVKRFEGTVTSGSGGSTPTPTPVEKGMPASGSTLEADNTTVAVVGSGAIKTLAERSWNVRVEEEITPLEGERWVISPGDRLVVSVSVPADSITGSCYVLWDEIGG
jgi:hypothetical protein